MEAPYTPAESDPEGGPIDCVEEEGSNENEEQPSLHGSSIPEAIFNFTNCIVGAGAIGLGGAIATSGGAISVALILLFGLLTKLSLDLVIRLSVETEGARGSFEDLAHVGLGPMGRSVVTGCKFLYSFGCLVAYIVVVKDNLPPALRNLIFGDTISPSEHDSWFYQLISQGAWFTWVISALFILPLCMLRDMTPLASFSVVSVVSMVSIVGIVVYMYFGCPDIGNSGGTFYENWIEVRPGVLESLGTFVFTFVSQHTVHLVFGSLKPNLRTVKNWKKISTYSILNATTVSVSVGVFVYMTFWQDTKSDIFQIYPQGWLIDVSKMLLCLTMILTFPLPFFTCRELFIVSVLHPFCRVDDSSNDTSTVPTESSSDENNLQEPLLNNENSSSENMMDTTRDLDTASISTDLSRRMIETVTPKNWLLPSDDRQLRLPGHIAVTGKLWFVTTALAIAAPSLGDVLDLVGCASGTLIAFIIPAILSFKIEGYSHLAMLIFIVGGAVGIVGTFFSVRKLFVDLA